MNLSSTVVVNKNHLFALFTVLIFSLGFFLRFYQLGSVPDGLYPDETAIGYNAYSILHSGKDEYGVPYPLYFRSFDDFKLPVYIYSTAASISLFGANAFAVRFPSALFGSLAIVALFFLVKVLSKHRWLAVCSAAFLALNPWHIFFSRAGYEVNVATSLMVFGVLFFVVGVKRKNNALLFLGAAVAFLLAVYTYNVTRLLAPVIFATLVAFYYKEIAKNSKRSLIFTLLVFAAGLIPFAVSFVTLQSEQGFSSHKDALIVGNAVRAEIIQTRSYFADLPHIVQKLFFNHWTLVAWTYLKNLTSFFSTNFFFIIGSDKPNQNIGGGMSMFYYFEIVTIIYGAYYGLKKRLTYLYPFYLWFGVVLLIGATVIIVPNGTRTYPVVIPLVVFSAFGFYTLFVKVSQVKNALLRRGIFVLIAFLALYSVCFYLFSYFYRFPVEYARDWLAEDQKTIEYIQSIEANYDKIIFDESAKFMYTSLLFYGRIDPALHHFKAKYRPDGLVRTLSGTGKYEFRKVDDLDHELGILGRLIITGGKRSPQGVTPLAEFSYPTRPVVLYFNRKIGQFPTTDVAYYIFSSDEYIKLFGPTFRK